MVYPNMDWQVRAKCKDADPKIFFPNRGEPSSEAKRLCNGCPVREQCRTHALKHDEMWGVWGGTGERERRSYRARRHQRERLEAARRSR